MATESRVSVIWPLHLSDLAHQVLVVKVLKAATPYFMCIGYRAKEKSKEKATCEIIEILVFKLAGD